MSDERARIRREARRATKDTKAAGVRRPAVPPADEIRWMWIPLPHCHGRLIEHRDGWRECDECDGGVETWHLIEFTCGIFGKCARCGE